MLKKEQLIRNLVAEEGLIQLRERFSQTKLETKRHFENKRPQENRRTIRRAAGKLFLILMISILVQSFFFYYVVNRKLEEGKLPFIFKFNDTEFDHIPVWVLISSSMMYLGRAVHLGFDLILQTLGFGWNMLIWIIEIAIPITFNILHLVFKIVFGLLELVSGVCNSLSRSVIGYFT